MYEPLVGVDAAGDVPAGADTAVDDTTTQRRATALIAVLGYCGALVSMMHTLALPLMPDLPEMFGATVGDVSWVATATLLAGAVANPLLGRLGDMYGKRRVFLLCIGLLVAGSAVAALAGSLWILVAGRTLQGLGVGVIPLGISIARDELPADKISGGIALVSATLGIGAGLGLPLSGFILEHADWHVLFWVSTALAAIGLVAAALVVAESPIRTPGRFDVLGALWLSVVLVAFLLPISNAATWGWASPLSLGLFAVAGVGGAGWGRYVLRRRDPIVDLAVMRRRPVLLANAAGVLFGFVMFNNFYGSIVLLQLPDTLPHGFGISLTLAGMILVPGALAMVVTSPISGRITDTVGARTTLVIGSIVIAVGFMLRVFLMDSLWTIALGFAVVNAGVGLAYGALPAVIMANVPVTETASANAVNALARSGGSSVSSAAVAALIGIHSVEVAANSYPTLAAFRWIFAASLALAAGSAVLAYLLPRQGPYRAAPLHQ